MHLSPLAWRLSGDISLLILGIDRETEATQFAQRGEFVEVDGGKHAGQERPTNSTQNSAPLILRAEGALGGF